MGQVVLGRTGNARALTGGFRMNVYVLNGGAAYGKPKMSLVKRGDRGSACGGVRPEYLQPSWRALALGHVAPS